jgi:hypothetical protein
VSAKSEKEQQCGVGLHIDSIQFIGDNCSQRSINDCVMNPEKQKRE